MKKRIASLALVATLLAGALPSHASSYPKDIANSRYKDAIEYSYDNNIVKGYSDGSFKPEDTISRAEFVVMVARWRKLSLGSRADFSDAKNSWASKEIAAVAKKGWMVGTGGGKFSPDEKISYIEALTVMVRAVGKKGEAEEFGGYPLGYSYTADRYGFTERISGSLESPIYRGAVSQLVYNSKDRFDAVEDGTEGSDSGLVDKLGTVKSYEFLESRNIRVQKDMDLASAIELLPREVYVVLESGRGVLLKVNWDSKSSYNKDSAGTYSIKGNVELPSGITDPKKKIPTLYGSIEVVEGEPDTSGEKIVNTYYELTVSEHKTDFGSTLDEAKAQLPPKITLYLIGGGSVQADISWSIPGYGGLVPKKYEAVGKIVLPTGVVDRLNILKDLKVSLTVDSEPQKLAIKNVVMVNALEYKITLNKFMQSILDGAVTVDQTGIGAKGEDEFVDKVSFGSSKRELVVKLKKPLVGTGYQFKVYDGEKTSETFPYIPKSDANKVDKIIVGDNIVPAGEETKINFKALNPDGIDITEAVRNKVKVVNTIEDKFSDQSFRVLHNQVEFFYLEYEDRNGDKKTTPTKRIIGENRRIVSIEDWSFAPDWSNTVKVLYKAGGDKKLYIKPKDQFGDTGKVEYLAGDSIKLDNSKTLKTDIASVSVENIEYGSNYFTNPMAKITLANPPKIGTASLDIEITRDGSSFKTAIPIKVVEDATLSALYLENPAIALSSSSLLVDSEDRSETVVVELRDQYGNTMNPVDISFSETPSGENSPIEISTVGGNEFLVTAKSGKSGTAKIKYTYGEKSIEQTVVVKAPGTVDDIQIYGFKEELKKDGDPTSMTLKLYQVDSEGLKVKKIRAKVTAEVSNAVEEENNFDISEEIISAANGVITIDSNSDGNSLIPNTLNTLTIKVGGIIVLEEKFVVR